MATEHDEQVALFQWAFLNSRAHPRLALMFAIPNGGQRHKAVAGKLKAEGVKSGVPDILLPVPNAEYAGLFIEMKRVKGGEATHTQMVWINNLKEQGYQAVVCRGWEEARKVIENYLSIGGVR